MGYTPKQVADLAATIEAVPCDLVLAATPIDLCRVLTCTRPVMRVAYAISEVGGEQLRESFSRLIP
jgi:predicted GTPase